MAAKAAASWSGQFELGRRAARGRACRASPAVLLAGLAFLRAWLASGRPAGLCVRWWGRHWCCPTTRRWTARGGRGHAGRSWGAHQRRRADANSCRRQRMSSTHRLPVLTGDWLAAQLAAACALLVAWPAGAAVRTHCTRLSRGAGVATVCVCAPIQFCRLFAL